MRPLDPRLVRAAPAARTAVVRLAALGLAQGIATVATAFALTALVMAVVEAGSSGSAEALTGPGAALAALFALRGLISAVQERVAARAGVQVQTQLRERLLGAWLRRDADTRPERSAALTLAAQGTTSIEPYVARFLPALVIAAVIPVLAIGTLVVVDWPSALIVALTIGLLPVFGALIGMTTRDDTQARWRALRDLSGHYLDVVRGLPTLVGYGRAGRQIETIREVSDGHRTATMRTLRLAFLSSAALELVATISVAIVAVTVGLRLVFGDVGLETGLLAILLAPEAYWPVRRVGAEFHSAADGTEALADLLDELDRPEEPERLEPSEHPEASEHPQATEHLAASLGAACRGRIEATDLTYTYPGSTTPVLQGVNLHAGTGLLVVTGPSGVGKSTLLEVLAGLRVPDAGSVRAAGPVHLVTQRPFLTAGSLRRNLLLGTPASAAGRLEQVLDSVGLREVVDRLPDGLDTPIGDDGFGLSAGQRARVVLARAVLAAAPVVLLDEPTAHLDPQSAQAIHRVIADLATQRTVVAVTHRDELIAIADDRFELRDARAEVLTV